MFICRFHAINNPVIDPVSLRKAKSSSTINKTPIPKSPSIPKVSTKWVPFSQRDSAALEKAYQVVTMIGGKIRSIAKTVCVV